DQTPPPRPLGMDEEGEGGAGEGAGEVPGPVEGRRGAVVEDQIAHQTAAETGDDPDHREADDIEVQPGGDRAGRHAHHEHAHEVQHAEEVVGHEQLKRVHPSTVVRAGRSVNATVTRPTRPTIGACPAAFLPLVLTAPCGSASPAASALASRPSPRSGGSAACA